jgi:D-alanyl-D-alanine dipeptidase
MKWVFALACVLWLTMFGQTARSQTNPAPQRRLVAANQLLVVKTANWETTKGTLQRYARTGRHRAWRPVGAPVPIVVGRSGLAWGAGLHGSPETLAQSADPLKREGDGKAPAGLFSLNAAFGYLPSAKTRRVKLPYVHSTATLQCVDDAQSAFYNRIVDRAQIKQPDWQSHEDMLRQDELYRWGIVVNHNAGGVGRSQVKAKPAGGSCIFLHIWGGADSSTSGCTAMEPALMEELLFWLDAKQQPLLVQLPESEYERLKLTWRLPE